MKYLKGKKIAIKYYPNRDSCIRADMKRVRPWQLPPLMCRKGAWRK